MSILHYILIIVSIVVIPFSFKAGYNYHKYKNRPRVSRPKQKAQTKRGTLYSTIIISPSRINDRRNIEKNLTS